eukprot:TRINITY_DN181_c0_g5_i2.p1 TRINITY_DN181_c0_g5~~TRINITY_DN181_c0_g5_i2.p1  ORF type:complete len:749 (+),score=216.61 TRINITY_DN181_c0_g5_i2:68-2248(+)
MEDITLIPTPTRVRRKRKPVRRVIDSAEGFSGDGDASSSSPPSSSSASLPSSSRPTYHVAGDHPSSHIESILHEFETSGGSVLEDAVWSSPVREFSDESTHDPFSTSPKTREPHVDVDSRRIYDTDDKFEDTVDGEEVEGEEEARAEEDDDLGRGDDSGFFVMEDHENGTKQDAEKEPDHRECSWDHDHEGSPSFVQPECKLGTEGVQEIEVPIRKDDEDREGENEEEKDAMPQQDGSALLVESSEHIKLENDQPCEESVGKPLHHQDLGASRDDIHKKWEDFYSAYCAMDQETPELIHDELSDIFDCMREIIRKHVTESEGEADHAPRVSVVECGFPDENGSVEGTTPVKPEIVRTADIEPKGEDAGETVEQTVEPSKSQQGLMESGSDDERHASPERNERSEEMKGTVVEPPESSVVMEDEVQTVPEVVPLPHELSPDSAVRGRFDGEETGVDQPEDLESSPSTECMEGGTFREELGSEYVIFVEDEDDSGSGSNSPEDDVHDSSCHSGVVTHSSSSRSMSDRSVESHITEAEVSSHVSEDERSLEEFLQETQNVLSGEDANDDARSIDSKYSSESLREIEEYAHKTHMSARGLLSDDGEIIEVSSGLRMKLIVDLFPDISEKCQLEIQNNRCPGCGRVLHGSKIFSRARLCHYTNMYFCKGCHTRERHTIPALVLHNWDFETRPVSRLASRFLKSIWNRPVICVSAVNPLLFDEVPALQDIRV